MSELILSQRRAIGRAIKAIISDISECNYAAGWYSGIEELLWQELQNHTHEWHGYSQDGDLLPLLGELSALGDCWVDYEHDFIPLNEWRAER